MLNLINPAHTRQTNNLPLYIPPLINPIRTVATNNKIFSGAETRGTKNRQASRWAYQIGTDASTLTVQFRGKYSKSSGEINLNDFKIVEAIIEANGTFQPVTWNSNRTKTITATDDNILCDEIPASAFGLEKFTKGTTVYFKGIIEDNGSLGGLPYTQFKTAYFTGQQSFFYDTATTTASATDVTGPYTFTGATDNRSQGCMPILLGRPLIDGVSCIGYGDSIMDENNDSGNTYPHHGIGFFNRAMHDGTGNALYPAINTARSGSSTEDIGQTEIELAKYARYAIDEMGTNDLGTINNLESFWQSIRDKGIEKIISCKLICRTTSTDNYLTEANQAYRDGWGIGEEKRLFNDYLETSLSTGKIDYLLEGNELTAAAHGGDRYKWRVDGVTNKKYNNDDVHPNTLGQEIKATPLRALIATLS